jgi:hypothetical protein
LLAERVTLTARWSVSPCLTALRRLAARLGREAVYDAVQPDCHLRQNPPATFTDVLGMIVRTA